MIRNIEPSDVYRFVNLGSIADPASGESVI